MSDPYPTHLNHYNESATKLSNFETSLVRIGLIFILLLQFS